MTSRLAVREKEGRATVAQSSLADLRTYVNACAEMDGEELGEYIERNWDNAVGNVSGLMFLVKEMKRKFKLLDRKKQVDGTYRTIRGFTSFDKWFTEVTGKSRREAYYLLETEEKKNQRNAERRTSEKKKDTDSATFIARCVDAKKTLAEIQRQLNKPSKYGEILDVKSLYGQIEPTIDAVFQEFLALISPKGYEVIQGENGWTVSKKDETEPEPPEEKRAKRSAAAKMAMATRAAAKKAAAPATKPAEALGACEGCCDGTPATVCIEKDDFLNSTYNYCDECAERDGKNDRKYLIRQMGVAKVLGCSLKDLVDLGGKTLDLGDGEIYTYPTVGDYVARLKERFLGNLSYDQTVVVEHIARIEKSMEAI